MGKRAELKVLRPRLVPLDAEGEREAIALLADSLLDAAGKRRADVSSGALRGASGSATGGVVSLPAKAGKAPKAA